MSEPTPPPWLAWVPLALGVVTGLGYIVKSLFIGAVEKVTRGMHQDNQARFREMESRQSDQEETLAWIRGRMEERWGKGDE